MYRLRFLMSFNKSPQNLEVLIAEFSATKIGHRYFYRLLKFKNEKKTLNGEIKGLFIGCELYKTTYVLSHPS